MTDRPTDAAIAAAQRAYDAGEVTLLEATFLADALSDLGPRDVDLSGTPALTRLSSHEAIQVRRR